MGNRCIFMRSAIAASQVSTLHRTGENTLNDIFLRKDIQNDNRDNRQNQNRHHGTPVDGSVRLLQELYRDRDGLVLVDIQHQVRQQIVVPYPTVTTVGFMIGSTTLKKV